MEEGRAPIEKPARRVTAINGRPLGPRAIKTRERLLEATALLLGERGVLDISVVEIARQAQTSPGTFYHYFPDVESAALELAERAAEEMPAIVALIDGPWDGDAGLDRARAIVRAFLDHWDAHHAVLSLRNLSAERGDARFQRVRRKALGPVLSHFAARLGEAQQRGHIAAELHPAVAAAALSAILERLSGHQTVLRSLQATRSDLVETCARILHQTVTGAGLDRGRAHRRGDEGRHGV